MREMIAGLVTPAMAVVFVVLFLILWHRGKMGSYVLAFAISYMFFAAGFMVTHVLDTAAFYTWHVTQFFYTVSTVCIAWGLARRVGQPTYLGIFLTIYVVAALALGAAIVLSPDVSARLVIVNIGYGVMAVVTMMNLLAAKRRRGIDNLIIGVQAVVAAQFLVRPSLTLLVETSISPSEYRESLYYAVLSLSVALISVISAMVLVGACIYDQVRAVRQRAELDALTGLRTRRAFEKDVVAMMDKAKAQGRPVALVVADIDHFKAVNDVYGHQVGDMAIAAFGEVIQDTIRDGDIAGRIGGEEFCVLAWNCEGAAAVAMADRIRTRFAALQVDGLPEGHRLTASFGVAGRREGEGYGKVFARSDAALYRAKETGRNRTLGDESGASADRVTSIVSEVDSLRRVRKA
ncbi:GGDEF domain-containing protein [Qipengyuania sp. 1NDH17]|uniref:diguanylate cyclase n=1 Tax=Qipengyuania polymorpha TaxID=2867234 RepID=A0ABS7IUL2_9SPHN|nr:GGDEF domain-containing protein [Qipengyuania polymorpha]MBX7456868.1 GGDEF domain-containing protein [Qipengyuania polymorpha]